MLTAAQIRMALAALRWSREYLAERAGVHWATIQRAASASGVPKMSAHNMGAVQAALEAGGVRFVPDGVIYREGGEAA